MEIRDLTKEWRIYVLLISLLTSTVLLFPVGGSNPLPYETDGENVELATNINEGLELSGGTRVLLSLNTTNASEETAQKVSNIIGTRISSFGLTQASVRTVRLGEEFNVQVQVASQNRSRLEELISQKGSFEARMPWTVSDSRKFELGNSVYRFRFDNGSAAVNGTQKTPGESFNLSGSKWYYKNSTDSQARFEVVAYDGEDVKSVINSDSRVTDTRGGSYNFRFPITLTTSAADRVQRISSNYGSVLVGGTSYLGQNGEAAPLRLYVDGTQRSSLNVASSFRSSPVTQPQISGGGETEAEAKSEMEELQAILQSGSLPVEVNIESISTVTSSLGSEFLSAAFISISASLLAVGGLIYLRYGDPKVVAPIVLTGASEVYILIGAWFSTVATLDLASIAGVIAAVGTGVDDQIIITDESGREKMKSWKERMKTAFFVIFTSAASTIGAMMPIASPSLSNLFLGIAGVSLIAYNYFRKKRNRQQMMTGILAAVVSGIAFQLSPSGFALQSIRGFAVTTILGVLIGITITRPAFAKILEALK